jgi:PHD/YefM family antitoxin component YafN of YafNO toxin-antitoxin module
MHNIFSVQEVVMAEVSSTEVSSAEVQRNFGAYRERAEGTHGTPEPVIVMHYNKPSVVIIAAGEYERLKRKDETVMMVAEAMPTFDFGKAAPVPQVPTRLGFMAGEIAVPDDFDRMGAAEIERLFGGES